MKGLMGNRFDSELVIVGAGIAGLSLAGSLRERGIASTILERSRGVGGRCATRRIDDWPVDHGLPFLHGRDPSFLSALDAVGDATPIEGWPARRAGGGLPCQPEAFEGADRLVAFREGLTRFPKHLARGASIRLGANVTALRAAKEGPRLVATLESGESMESSHVVLTLPAPRALRLLDELFDESPAAAAVRPLVESIRTIPCLTVIAVYDNGAPAPEWDVLYPVSSTMVHAVVHDTTKRAPGAPRTLVVQGRPRFSREYSDAPAPEWAKELLWEAGEFAGSWVERPRLRQEHVWRHARVDAVTELSAPIAIRLENGAILGLCGDGFAPGGGAQGAFQSGRSLAARIEMLRETPARAS